LAPLYAERYDLEFSPNDRTSRVRASRLHHCLAPLLLAAHIGVWSIPCPTPDLAGADFKGIAQSVDATHAAHAAATAARAHHHQHRSAHASSPSQRSPAEHAAKPMTVVADEHPEPRVAFLTRPCRCGCSSRSAPKAAGVSLSSGYALLPELFEVEFTSEANALWTSEPSARSRCSDRIEHVPILLS
jgi:hypothetical protein